jgi:hypothetical protein
MSISSGRTVEMEYRAISGEIEEHYCGGLVSIEIAF